MKTKDQRLLLIAPHAKVFIKDQIRCISRNFAETNLLVPIPRFSSLMYILPYTRRHYRFLHLILKSTEEKKETYSILPFHYYTFPIDFFRKRYALLASKKCIATIRKKRIAFNIIHAHFLQNGLIAARIKKLYNKPFVLTAHGGEVYGLSPEDEYRYSSAGEVIRYADHLIAVSKYILNKLISLGASENKISVIPNGYDKDLFRLQPVAKMRKKLNLPLEKKIILSVGNLVPIKGHRFLIEAMKQVLEKRDDVLLIIIGSGPGKESLQREITQNQKKKIWILDRKHHSSIPAWMNASDLFVLPSLGEGFPTVIPEAMACGKPVIASNVGGVPEIIINRRLGALTEAGNSSELAGKILLGLESSWDSDYISKYADQFSWENLAHSIIEVYNKVQI